jgi:hypothetical protein
LVYLVKQQGTKCVWNSPSPSSLSFRWKSSPSWSTVCLFGLAVLKVVLFLFTFLL